MTIPRGRQGGRPKGTKNKVVKRVPSREVITGEWKMLIPGNQQVIDGVSSKREVHDDICILHRLERSGSKFICRDCGMTILKSHTLYNAIDQQLNEEKCGKEVWIRDSYFR